jgi:ketosteroid isomerase-like protein
MEADNVSRWVTAYEATWRTPGTDGLAALFAEGATYLVSPWAEPVIGLAAIAELWEAERERPDEEFTMTSSVVAVDGSAAVVRAEVHYARGETWRDLWVLEFDDDGRCRAFEEWPFAPEQPDGH